MCTYMEHFHAQVLFVGITIMLCSQPTYVHIIHRDVHTYVCMYLRDALLLKLTVTHVILTIEENSLNLSHVRCIVVYHLPWRGLQHEAPSGWGNPPDVVVTKGAANPRIILCLLDTLIITVIKFIQIVEYVCTYVYVRN